MSPEPEGTGIDYGRQPHILIDGSQPLIRQMGNWLCSAVLSGCCDDF